MVHTTSKRVIHTCNSFGEFLSWVSYDNFKNVVGLQINGYYMELSIEDDIVDLVNYVSSVFIPLFGGIQVDIKIYILEHCTSLITFIEAILYANNMKAQNICVRKQDDERQYKYQDMKSGELPPFDFSKDKIYYVTWED